MQRTIILFLAFISLLIQSINCVSQTKEPNYYWFNITVKTPDGSESSKIRITNIGSGISSGTFNDFLESHNSALKSGRIAVGPFVDRVSAENSQNLYRRRGQGMSNSDEESKLWFFFVKPVKQENSSAIKFESIPSRVTGGSDNIFSAIMSESLSFERLAIGPFSKYELAERSKYVFMKNGRLFGDKTTDSIRSVNLHLMAKKWKKYNVSLVPKKLNKELKKTICRFGTRFSRHYFAPEAVQVILVSATYQNPTDGNIHGTSLQGSNVLDNNRVISYDMATSYVELIYFNYVKGNKITGFVVDSFIYNDSELIQLPTKFIKVRK